MGMQSYPIQGVGVRMNSFDWKDSDIYEQIEDDNDPFYAEQQPNGVTAYIEFVRVDDGSNDDDCYLITYNYKAYQQTPFNTFEELQEFYVRGLREHVNNTDEEIRASVEDVDVTFWG